MNDIIKVNYNTDQPTVSARELHEFLESCKQKSIAETKKVPQNL